jgi:hypothetical protein
VQIESDAVGESFPGRTNHSIGHFFSRFSCWGNPETN